MIPPIFIERRLERLLTILQEKHLDGILVSHQPNIAYLTGFQGSDSYLLITANKNFLVTDFRYYQQAHSFLTGRFTSLEKALDTKCQGSLPLKADTGIRLPLSRTARPVRKEFSNGVKERSSLTGFNYENKGIFDIRLTGKSVFKTIAKLAIGTKTKHLGFEARNLSFTQHERIKSFLCSVHFIPSYNLIEDLRELKEAEEVNKIKEAVNITVQALKYARKIIRPGLSEIEIAGQLERFIRYKGARTSAFETIVASGKNSSFPHHLTSEEKLKSGDCLLIDIGVDYQGYKSDLTRTFFLGKISSKSKRIFDIVRQAQILAISRIKPGIKLCEIDIAARNYIDRCGYAGFFGHNLGHGIGLEIHEQPSVSANNKTVVQAGMVFTVEPAIYLPNEFGIRIEDDVMVTKDGGEVLSDNLDK